ncbi:hypothetical protein OGATHE_001773 [Ogataea polymorpha]|uniref:Uncharacterized protein n=1 Tax=Ogataea polymorpha TaxID=460523 RepID=A0A9P8PKF0_9ASCO|nr:hypothetical protein OGATHE_001773 [Ogataea polymorpha]
MADDGNIPGSEQLAQTADQISTLGAVRCELSNQVPYLSSRARHVRNVSGLSSLPNTSNLLDVIDSSRLRISGVVLEQIMELKIEPELEPDTILGSRSSSSSVEKTPMPSIPKQLPPLIVMATRP